VVDRPVQLLAGDEVSAQRRVDDRDGLLERLLSRQVDKGARDGGGREPVHRRDLVGVQRCDVHVQGATAVSARRAVAGDVHAVQRYAPHGQAVQDRGREVAHRRS
jgi:hypothetical protein